MALTHAGPLLREISISGPSQMPFERASTIPGIYKLNLNSPNSESPDAVASHRKLKLKVIENF
jgi:hypothetical protein